jgi:hypothetical protein
MRFRPAVLVAFGLLLPAPGLAQGVEPGVEGAVVFAKFGGDDAEGAETRVGVAGGGFLRIPLGSWLALEPALLYSTQGTKVDVGGGATGTFKLDYWQLPLRIRLSAPFGSSASVRPYVYAGPAIGIRDRCRIEVAAQGQSLEADCNDEDALGGVAFETKTFETSLHFGGGVEWRRISLGVRYQLGLSSVDNSDFDADLKNRVFAITIGYRFRGAP